MMWLGLQCECDMLGRIQMRARGGCRSCIMGGKLFGDGAEHERWSTVCLSIYRVLEKRVLIILLVENAAKVLVQSMT